MIPDRTPPETIQAEVLARSQRPYDALLNGLAAVVWEMEADTLRLNFTSGNIEAVFGHPLRMLGAGPRFLGQAPPFGGSQPGARSLHAGHRA